MPSIKTRRTDIVWNYIGTIVSMASGFVLLPLLLRYLSSAELGLWYVYLSIANLCTLFEFGFNPTFARNIVYVVSGARRLTAEGKDTDSLQSGVDWHLLNVVIRSSKIVYAAIALAALLILLTVGTAYIGYISTGINEIVLWVSWGIFCVAIFLNLYFLYSITLLRGYGDVAGENRSKTFSKILQLVVSACFLASGFGLIGAAAGYLVNAAFMRLFAVVRLRSHKRIEEGRLSDTMTVTPGEVKEVFGTVGHLAWRDGLVQLSGYASTQSMSILSSLFLGLAETGTYSVLLQLGTAVYHFAAAYPKSFFPSMQAAYAEGNLVRQRKIVSKGVVAYWALFLFGVVGICAVVLPLLPAFKPDVHVDYTLFLAISLYLALWNQHSIFCSYIISMNEIPYMAGYLVAAVLGTALVCLFSGALGMGAWGIVLGQAVSQLVYNNWKWPVYLCAKIGLTYRGLLVEGISEWRGKLVQQRR